MTAQTQITNKYGIPSKEYREKYCEIWDIAKDFSWCLDIKVGTTEAPFKRLFINKDFKSKIFVAFTNLEKAGLHKEIKTYDGCYVERKVRGRESMSIHSWAMAIDFNASLEGLGHTHTNWSGQFVAIMKAAGMFWGGDWRGRKDPMHFSLYNG